MRNAPSPSGPDRTAGPQRSSVLTRLRGHLSLSRVQAIFGLIAALLSIGGSLYYYLGPSKLSPNTGEVVATVQEAASGKAVNDANVELLTPKDALVTTINVNDPRARQRVREGNYRLRVTHPRYATEVRPVQVIGGQTAEIHVRLVPRPATPPPPTASEKAVNEGVEALKKIFR